MDTVTRIFPTFIRPYTANDGASDGFLTFPIELIPLQASLTITRSRAYIKHEFADGNEQRERKGISRGFVSTSFTILLDEGKSHKTKLEEFFEKVECHLEFFAFVPGVGTRLWFFEAPPDLSHVRHLHWNAKLNLKSQRAS